VVGVTNFVMDLQVSGQEQNVVTIEVTVSFLKWIIFLEVSYFSFIAIITNGFCSQNIMYQFPLFVSVWKIL
jgi:hypothetical protein